MSAESKFEIEIGPPSTFAWEASAPVEGDDRRDIIVLMSGGVDSSVTALLLREAGWRVLGITMITDDNPQCASATPAQAGAAAARALGIAHYVLDVRKAFDSLVLGHFRNLYLQGRTPNPCVGCNAFIKFGAVWDFVEARFGVQHLATGHYVRVDRTGAGGKALLQRAASRARDQSYFLYWVRPERVAFLEFPLGGLDKDRVREIARAHGIPSAETGDSMDFCLFGKGSDYRPYLRQFAPEGDAEGPVLDAEGRELGRHEGVFNYTVGQRKGIPAAGKPLYVTGIHPAKRSITVGPRAEVMRREVRTETTNVFAPERLGEGARLFGKIRSLGEPAPCSVLFVGPSSRAVEFDAPQFAPAPGQHLVLYDEEGRVMAGGMIARV